MNNNLRNALAILYLQEIAFHQAILDDLEDQRLREEKERWDRVAAGLPPDPEPLDRANPIPPI
jgi:hypothetical protein